MWKTLLLLAIMLSVAGCNRQGPEGSQGYQFDKDLGKPHPSFTQEKTSQISNKPKDDFAHEADLDATVEKLSKLRLADEATASLGGPWVVINHNDVTRAVVAKGRPIIPRLLKRLDVCDYDEAVFVVFCLRQLHAKEAKNKIIELQESLKKGERIDKKGRDLTLDVNIIFYLRDVESW